MIYVECGTAHAHFNGHIDYGAVDLPCTYLQFSATERYIRFATVKCGFVVSAEQIQTEKSNILISPDKCLEPFFPLLVFRMQGTVTTLCVLCSHALVDIAQE